LTNVAFYCNTLDMAKKTKKRAIAKGKKHTDFLGYCVCKNPSFVVSLGVLIITVIFVFVVYFAR